MTLILAEVPAIPVSATPPSWVTSGPDDDGNCNGTSTVFESLDLSVKTAWSAKDGPVMWMDALIYASQDISPADARKIAVALLNAADLVEAAR